MKKRTLISFFLLVSVAWATEPVQATDLNRRISVQVWLDDTESTSTEDRRNTIEALLEALPQLSADAHVDEWRFFGFGENPLLERPFYRANIPRLHPPSCPPLGPVSGDVGIFTIQDEERQKKHQEECRANENRAKSALAAEVRKTFSEMRRAVRAHQPSSAKCTAIADLLARVGQDTSPRYVLVISDGRETCRPHHDIPLLSPPWSAQVALVLIQSKEAQTAKGMLSNVLDERRKQLRTAAPWLAVLPSFAMDETLFAKVRARNARTTGGGGMPTATPR